MRRMEGKDDVLFRNASFQEFIKRVLASHPGKKLVLLFDEYELFGLTDGKGVQ